MEENVKVVSEVEKSKLLIAMYKSVDRMNVHYSRGNTQGVMSEVSLQQNLRHNFNELDKLKDE